MLRIHPTRIAAASGGGGGGRRRLRPSALPQQLLAGKSGTLDIVHRASRLPESRCTLPNVEPFGSECELLDLDDEWREGCRYEVQRELPVFATQETTSKMLGTLQAKDLVLVLNLEEASGERASPRAYVYPVGWPCEAGWICIDGPPHAETDSGTVTAPVRRRKLKNSWQLGGRYSLKATAVMREEADLASSHVAELRTGTEVLLLEFAVVQMRLRAMVRAETGQIGWVTAEQTDKKRLLDTKNLLGPEVVDLHRSQHVTGKSRSSLRRFLAQQGDAVKKDGPWRLGGHYRVLETIPFFEDKEALGPEKGLMNAALIVEVRDLHYATCPELRWRPNALVQVLDAPADFDLAGWVTCAADDGRDLVDSRDQREYGHLMEALLQRDQEVAHANPPVAAVEGVEGPISEVTQPESEVSSTPSVQASPLPAVSKDEKHDAAAEEVGFSDQGVAALAGAATTGGYPQAAADKANAAPQPIAPEPSAWLQQVDEGGDKVETAVVESEGNGGSLEDIAYDCTSCSCSRPVAHSELVLQPGNQEEAAPLSLPPQMMARPRSKQSTMRSEMARSSISSSF
eukprot:TRINITY_DN32626_c0_g2_i1.p1 TRINITY_DN32626_c0_g2~~TRINITY_DN32626_c0_g2_i1.p1  ORF type:complete len:571 (-),score=112.66 TRINITY_DN32626_c0_g2_i1:60-1772(-)